MQRPIEFFALLDYIKKVIINQEYDYLSTEPFETIFISYSDEPLISNISKDLSNSNFIEAINQINTYEQANSQLYQLYLTIKADYQGLDIEHSKEDIENMLQDKYGIMQVDELVTLLEAQSKFIQEHKFP